MGHVQPEIWSERVQRVVDPVDGAGSPADNQNDRVQGKAPEKLCVGVLRELAQVAHQRCHVVDVVANDDPQRNVELEEAQRGMRRHDPAPTIFIPVRIRKLRHKRQHHWQAPRKGMVSQLKPFDVCVAVPDGTEQAVRDTRSPENAGKIKDRSEVGLHEARGTRGIVGGNEVANGREDVGDGQEQHQRERQLLERGEGKITCDDREGADEGERTDSLVHRVNLCYL